MKALRCQRVFGLWRSIDGTPEGDMRAEGISILDDGLFIEICNRCSLKKTKILIYLIVSICRALQAFSQLFAEAF